MKSELRYAFYLIALGASLVVYAHATFSTKGKVNSLHDDVKEIRNNQRENTKTLNEIKGAIL